MFGSLRNTLTPPTSKYIMFWEVTLKFEILPFMWIACIINVIMKLVVLKPSTIVPRTTTWGPLSNYKWWMHEVTKITSSQDKEKK
jgi:hypothetical protein